MLYEVITDGLSFLDALEELANLHGLSIPREQGTPGSAPAPAISSDQYQLRNNFV